MQTVLLCPVISWGKLHDIFSMEYLFTIWIIFFK